MKLKDIQTGKDLENYIESILNDFEGGISTKEETSGLIADLLVYVTEAVVKRKSLNEVINNDILNK